MEQNLAVTLTLISKFQIKIWSSIGLFVLSKRFEHNLDCKSTGDLYFFVNLIILTEKCI